MSAIACTKTETNTTNKTPTQVQFEVPANVQVTLNGKPVGTTQGAAA